MADPGAGQAIWWKRQAHCTPVCGLGARAYGRPGCCAPAHERLHREARDGGPTVRCRLARLGARTGTGVPGPDLLLSDLAHPALGRVMVDLATNNALRSPDFAGWLILQQTGEGVLL